MLISLSFHLIPASKPIFRFTFTENPALVASKLIFHITFTVFDPDCAICGQGSPVLAIYSLFYFIKYNKIVPC